ncbi:hypothetical protein OIU78_016651 [Salix suchowensis]|nr:hypothetical protein OIU78_016651 [Salix suchowensis]
MEAREVVGASRVRILGMLWKKGHPLVRGLHWWWGTRRCPHVEDKVKKETWVSFVSSDLIGRYVCHRIGSEELDGWEPEFVMNHPSGVSNEDCICCLPGFCSSMVSCLVVLPGGWEIQRGPK